MWRFLHPIDLVRLINADELLRLVELDTESMRVTIDMAVELVISYLLKRYDESLAFPQIKVWQVDQDYTEGDLVVSLPPAFDLEAEYGVGDQVTYNSLVFKATQATTGDAPGQGFKSIWSGVAWRIMRCTADHTSEGTIDGTKFEAVDPRNQVLVSATADIVVYELMARAMPDAMPDVRKDRYKAAISMLSRVATGKQSIDLPPAPTNTLGSRRLVVAASGSRPQWD